METKMSKNRNTFSAVFHLRKSRILKNGEAPLFLRLTVNGKVADIPVAGSVPVEQWRQTKERSRGKNRNAHELNNTLDLMKARVFKIYTDLKFEDKVITAQKIKDIYLGIDKQDEGKSLVEVHAEHNERCNKLLNIEYSQSTLYKFDASLKHLKEFMSGKLNKEDIPISQINEDFIRNYEAYLKADKGYGTNTAIKQMKILKKIIRIALANDWLQKDPFVTIKFRQEEVHVEFLTLAELETVINKKIENKRLDQIRDVFVFCSFTGLAFVDIKGLQEEHMITDNNGEMWIRKPRQKTNNMCNIPLLKIPKLLLEKYKNDICRTKGQLLPVPTNQKMNAYLKETADI